MIFLYQVGIVVVAAEALAINIVNKATIQRAVRDYACGQLVVDQRDIENAVDVIAAVTALSGRTRGFDLRKEAVEVRLVADVANGAGL